MAKLCGVRGVALSLFLCAAAAARQGQVIVGLGDGGLSQVRVHDALSGATQSSFLAYGAGFTGGVRVAAGDVNNDGVYDIVTGAGPGGAGHVKAFSGLNGGPEIASFFAYGPSFTGGVYVAAGDLNNDDYADMITGSELVGGPHVRAFSGANGSTLASFFAFDPAFSGGVRVAAGDVNNDGHADVVAGAGPGAGPHVKVFSGANGAELSSFFAFSPTFSGGIFVASGDVNGDGRFDIVAGADAGAGPQVSVFSGADGSLLLSFFAFDPTFSGGVRVASADVNGDGRADIIAGAGPGGAPHVRVFSGVNGSLLSSFISGDPQFTGGVYVAAVPSPGAAGVLIAGLLAARRRRRG